MTYTNYSGKAIGSDQYWELIGNKYGVRTINYTTNTMDLLSIQQGIEVEEAYNIVFRQINRGYLNPLTYSGKLVRRNYLQAKAGHEIFAIGNLVKGQVQGGTAYCVQYAINMGKPIWFFDQITDNWLKYDNVLHQWDRCDCPTLGMKNTTVGTRELKPNGMKAIEEVYIKTFNIK